MGTSLPARGEWIEMCRWLRDNAGAPSLSPHGESGLKYVLVGVREQQHAVSPRMGRVD